jgi:ElaB/YqjD/DUF883 family membrane-anchored ribosome-binding protein
MTEEIGTPPIAQPEETPGEASIEAPVQPQGDSPAEAVEIDAGAAWDDVVARLGDLGDAIAGWTKAAANSPENRRRVEELRANVNEMTGKAQATFAGAADDFGDQVRQGVSRAGQAIEETVQKVSAAAAPHVANALAELAYQFANAASKVEEAVKQRPPSPKAPEPPTPPQPEAPADAPAEGVSEVPPVAPDAPEPPKEP